MISYTLIAGLLLYFAVIRLATTTSIRPITSSAIVVLGYFGISTAVYAIILSAIDDAPMWQLFGVEPIMSLILQFTIAFIVFLKIDQDNDSFGALVLYGTLGCVGIFFLVPFAVSRLLGGL